ncbi:MAG: bifunctional folylpolyglutamate synthase/dihydrofolate synthase [candidate division Zixibacteria bacterium]|nr:bifunctional folylpolyglutamate synthase/dihydrofolate synthase [candidate division Zixibacteria bacterium]
MEHSYVSAERFILSREFFGMKLGLENIAQFLEDIGSPQHAYPTIHLAGTNGKGSTAAMIAGILGTSGYRTGLFTSPHLVTLRERMRVDGRMIPRRSVTAFIDRHRRELARRKLSFFELITAMALDYFKRARVDLAVIETGLGGRLDATNVLAPILTITTDISRDHTEILGTSLRKIAYEKAGIIKPSAAHLISLLPDIARLEIQRRCKELGAPMHRLTSSDFKTHPSELSFDFQANGWRLTKLSTALAGHHQLTNAALALKALSIIDKLGISIPVEAMRKGLRQVQWPGRFQVLKRRGQPTVVLDVCHNAAGVAAFVKTFGARFKGRKAHIITGFVQRKPHREMFRLLNQIALEFHLVPLKTRRRADLDELTSGVDFSGVPVYQSGSLVSAFQRLVKRCRPDDTIVVAGSHYLVGEYLEKLK